MNFVLGTVDSDVDDDDDDDEVIRGILLHGARIGEDLETFIHDHLPKENVHENDDA